MYRWYKWNTWNNVQCKVHCAQLVHPLIILYKMYKEIRKMYSWMMDFKV